MNKEKLKEVIAFAKTTDLQEIIWGKKGIAHALSPFRGVRHAGGFGGGCVDDPGGAEPEKTPEKMVIRSTMVGTFYRADSKSRPPLVVEGTLVTAGQPVAAVEAMKIMKDVLSPSDCKIIKALVDNGHAVEYGQPLFEIEPVAQNENV